MKKPFYVDRGGEQVYRAPFRAENVDFWGFLLKADKAKMQASICDLCLNGPSNSPGRFQIAMPYALVVFNKNCQFCGIHVTAMNTMNRTP
ncbi:MAG: hypothetical protein AAFN05_04040, partial [Pseudomonadota bacterium]